MSDSTGLSDVLRGLADDDPPPSPPPPEAAPPPVAARPPVVARPRAIAPPAPIAADDEDEVFVGELDESPPAPTPAPGSAHERAPGSAPGNTPAARSATARRRGVMPATPKFDVKETMVPILFTVGMLLLFPAVWGTLVLMGMEIWRSEQPGARMMAALMQLCYPIGVILIAAAVIFFRQVMRKKAESRQQTPAAAPRSRR